jgi:hypothetical protein
MRAMDSEEIGSLAWAIEDLDSRPSGTGYKAKLGAITVYPDGSGELLGKPAADKNELLVSFSRLLDRLEHRAKTDPPDRPTSAGELEKKGKL